MSTERILYSFRRCPYAIRARLALAISETSYELREVRLSRKPAAMLEASPKGTVPVLVLADGSVIDESSQIMRWALDRNDPEGWLERDDAALIERNDGRFKHDLDRYKYPDRHDSDALEHRQRGMEFLGLLDARLAEHAHLCGSQRGMADAAIMPFVRQFAGVDSEWFAAQPIPHLQKWLADQLASPLFSQVMLRVDAWSPGDPAVVVSGVVPGQPGG
ncbi:glutathione S-transferase [Citromicrobium bathyomarinum]